MKKLELNWHIKRASVNLESLEDECTKIALQKVRELCNKNKHKQAVRALPAIYFSFDGDLMDGNYLKYFKKIHYHFQLDGKKKQYKIKVGVDGNKLILSIWIIFEVCVNDGIDINEFYEYLCCNGGWSAGRASGSWSYIEDDGGHFYIMNHMKID